MAVPVLEWRGNFEVFSKQMHVYTKLHGFDNVFGTDGYVDVGAYGNEKGVAHGSGCVGIHVGEAADSIGFSITSFTVKRRLG